MSDDLDRIRMEDQYKETTKSHNDVMNLYKALQINLGKLEVSNEELLELISYFEQTEQFEVCQKLKSKLK